MKKLVVLLIATFVSTTALAGSSDKISEVVLSEYAGCKTITTFDMLSMLPTIFNVSEIESLTISDGILEITGGMGKDKTRRIQKATNQLNLAWMVTDKKKGESTLLLAFTGLPDSMPGAEALSKVLETEYEAATNTVTLLNMIKLPVIINKVTSKISSFSIDDSTLSVEFDNANQATLIMTSLNALQQVTVKEDTKKGTRNVIALFAK